MSSSRPQFPTIPEGITSPMGRDARKQTMQKQAAILRRASARQAIQGGKLTNEPDDRVGYQGI